MTFDHELTNNSVGDKIGAVCAVRNDNNIIFVH